MSTDQQALSKFVVYFQDDAKADTKRPALKGNFALDTGESFDLALWSGEREDGKGLYLTGQAVAKNVTDALKARHASADQPNAIGVAPPGLDMRRGQVVLFQTPADKLAENPKRPAFYGYAHLIEGYFRIAAWEHGKALTGSLQVNQPRDPAPEPETPKQRKKPQGPKAGQG